MLKGNHDYWWNSIKKMKEYLALNKFEDIYFLHNNSFEIEEYIIAGTRGWNINTQEEENIKIINREILRLEMSIKAGIEKFGNDKTIIVCMHYPPTNRDLKENSEFIKLMKKYNVKKCIYGHLHGESLKNDIIEEEISRYSNYAGQ